MKISEIEQKQINEKLNTLKELDIVQETDNVKSDSYGYLYIEPKRLPDISICLMPDNVILYYKLKN